MPLDRVSLFERFEGFLFFLLTKRAEIFLFAVEGVVHEEHLTATVLENVHQDKGSGLAGA